MIKTAYNIFICLFLTVAVFGTFVSCSFYGASVFLALGFCLMFFLIKNFEPDIKTVIAIAFILRFISAFMFPVPLFSDYLKYHETAVGLIHNTPLDKAYLSAFPHTFSYSFLISLIYRVFGENPQIIYIINAILGTLTTYVIYKCSNTKTAFIFAIFPQSVLYTSLFATEIPYTLLFFLTLMFVLKGKSIFSGITLGLMNLIRPTGIVFIIAHFIYSFFFKKERRKFFIFLAVYIAFSFCANFLIEKTGNFEIPENNFGYSLYVGLNSESLGRWNSEDYNYAMSFSDSQNMHNELLINAKDRFINNGFWGNIRLLFSKFALSWGSGNLICYYLKLSPFFVSLTQGFHLFVAIMAFIALWHKKENGIILPALLVLGHTALYLITETMERYVYTAFAVVILIMMKGQKAMFFKYLKADIDAVLERDPASKSRLEVYFLSPGVKALKMHRWANFFWRYGFEFIAKFISMRARKKTGIEIHPAATIGKGVMIDHGMGVVIGETAVVGDNCTIYQNVTLGGTGKDTGKRHPTIGNNVMIGSGAKVLGPFSVGDNSKIASNAVVLSEVPPNSTCVGVPARVVKQNNKRVSDCEWQMDQTHIPDPVSQELCKIIMRLEKLEERNKDNENI